MPPLFCNAQNQKVEKKKTHGLKNLLKSYPQTMLVEKKRKKIKTDDFVIPRFCDYRHILRINYNCKQLKSICSHYKIPKTGNKNILSRRIFTFLKLSYYVILIQKKIKGWIVRHFIKLSGPALTNRDLCVNQTDFLTLGNIKTIPIYNFISFKDSSQKI